MRSTTAYREAAFDRMRERMEATRTMTDDQLCEEFSSLYHFAYSRAPHHTREDLIVSIAIGLARRIINA